jgi:hypothetical protein
MLTGCFGPESGALQFQSVGGFVRSTDLGHKSANVSNAFKRSLAVWSLFDQSLRTFFRGVSLKTAPPAGARKMAQEIEPPLAQRAAGGSSDENSRQDFFAEFVPSRQIDVTRIL